jgi:hypothetical protein
LVLAMHSSAQRVPNFLVVQALKMPHVWVQLRVRLPQQ